MRKNCYRSHTLEFGLKKTLYYPQDRRIEEELEHFRQKPLPVSKEPKEALR